MPAVKASFVIGVPSKRLDEEVAVYIQVRSSYFFFVSVTYFVQLNEGASITIDDVKAHCKNGLARFKHPKYIKFEDTYPLTTTGKVQKFLLQKQALEDFPELKDEIQE